MPYANADQQRAYNRRYQKAWRSKNPNKAKAIYKRWCDKNKAYRVAKALVWKLANADKVRSYRRRRNLEAYGITEETYRSMAEIQRGLCAICLRPERSIRNGKIKPLAVDHDHSSGKVRGLLCHDCNLTIGKMRDSPRLLRRAAAYLESHGAANDDKASTPPPKEHTAPELPLFAGVVC